MLCLDAKVTEKADGSSQLRLLLRTTDVSTGLMPSPTIRSYLTAILLADYLLVVSLSLEARAGQF